jgi:hypothetical protein
MTRTLRGRLPVALAAAAAIGLGACSQDLATPVQPGDGSAGLRLSSAPAVEASLMELLESTNATLEAGGYNLRVRKIEAISGDPDEAGATVLWKNTGNKRLEDDFVAGDPRRMLGSPEGGWDADPNDISFAIDQNDATTFNGVGPAVTNAEIRDAMATWDDVQCSDLGLHEVSTAQDLGFVAAVLGFGGSTELVADIQHAGWLEVEFGGATIAATFTIIWVDDAGVPTDIDGNGMDDVAAREIYYDAVCQACTPVTFWNWEIDDGVNEPGQDIDIESIVLHESGHGLSQAHFGKGFTTHDGTVLHQTSNSVMAAAYAGPRTDLQGTDNGGHCSNWANWPNS